MPSLTRLAVPGRQQHRRLGELGEPFGDARTESTGGGEARTAPCLTPSPGGRGRCTPRHRRPQRRGRRDDRTEGVIPSRRGWRPRPQRQRGRTPRAIPAPVSGDAGPAASRGQGRRREPRGHGPRSSSTPGRHPCRPRDATATSEPRRQRHRGRCAPTQAFAPHGPYAHPRVRARRQASGSVSLDGSRCWSSSITIPGARSPAPNIVLPAVRPATDRRFCLLTLAQSKLAGLVGEPPTAICPDEA
jgi:hypothetical protein